MNAGCAGKTVRSLENACHTWAPQRCVHDEALYKYMFTFTFTLPSSTSLTTVAMHTWTIWSNVPTNIKTKWQDALTSCSLPSFSESQHWWNIPVEGTVSDWQAVHCGWTIIWFQRERSCDTSSLSVYWVQQICRCFIIMSSAIQYKHFCISHFKFNQLAFFSYFMGVLMCIMLLRSSDTLKHVVGWLCKV